MISYMHDFIERWERLEQMPSEPNRYIEIRKSPKACALPGCNRAHSHNGGYCCAQHSKEHKELIKAKVISIYR